MPPKVYFVVHKSIFDSVFLTLSDVLFDGFTYAGATVLTHEQLVDLVTGDEDRVIVYGGLDEATDEVKRRFAAENRWLLVVDEMKGGDVQPYGRAAAYAKDTLETNNIITTYQNAEHMAWLDAQGMKRLYLPQCVPCVRPMSNKTYSLLISGQVDQHPDLFIDYNPEGRPYYVTRTKVALAVKHSYLNDKATWLSYPNTSRSTARHQWIGEGYMQLLDMHALAVTCKAADHDRFVGKYVEFGAAHVLPVGDCPSYMPDAMKQAMINVEGMDEKQITEEIDRVLRNIPELVERVNVYSDEVAKRYLSGPNCKRIVEEVTT